MANVHRVLIEGRIPFNIVQKGSDIVKFNFAMFSSPCWGFDIEYGNTSEEPNKWSGKTTYYDFKIFGEEAMWGSHIDEFVSEMKKAGAEIKKCSIVDIEA